MKKLLSVLMAAAMLVGVLSLAGCGGNGGETTTDPAADADNSAATTETAGDLTTVTAGKLTMSTNAQFPPYEMVADDGSFEGIDIEVADAIAKKLGLELQVDDMDFDAALLAAQNGKSARPSWTSPTATPRACRSSSCLRTPTFSPSTTWTAR